MRQVQDEEQLNTEQIKLHLRSAIGVLTPDLLERIDLSTPQNPVPDQTGMIVPGQQGAMVWGRLRILAAVAACLCVLTVGGMTGYLNQRVDSVVGIDVNPSVELSINRRDKVLHAEALNDDAAVIMEEMDLKGVDVNIAVNAIIGSMVTHGYLDDLDNAILVTVSNDSVSKASRLRASLVSDIEQTLQENEVQAVVYDQQVVERDEMKSLADQYGISYGKAYFLKELIDQNPELNIADMELLSTMTMEEIAEKITEKSYSLGEFADQAKEKAPETSVSISATEEVSTEELMIEETEMTLPESTEETETSTPAESSMEETTTVLSTTEETKAEEVVADLVDIDYVDVEGNSVFVHFGSRVKWKEPTVSVKDEEGNSYSAMVEDTSSSECEIHVSGLKGGRSYTFVLGGLAPSSGGKSTTVTGYFEAAEIADELLEPEDEEQTSEENLETEASQPETVSGETKQEESVPPETIPPETSQVETSRSNPERNETTVQSPSDEETAISETKPTESGSAAEETITDEVSS